MKMKRVKVSYKYNKSFPGWFKHELWEDEDKKGWLRATPVRLDDVPPKWVREQEKKTTA